VTIELETLQTSSVVDPRVTRNPDDAVALIANGDVPKFWFGKAPK
jgi:hypothetical protein